MTHEEAVQELKHHKLTYHTVTDTMLEKESELMVELPKFELECVALDVVLECTVPSCKLGPGGTAWRTASEPYCFAKEWLDMHLWYVHGIEELSDVKETNTVWKEKGEPVRKTSCSCCRNGVKSAYHWNNCSVLGCWYLTD